MPLERIGDEVAERPVYRDELGITAYGGSLGKNYLLTFPSGNKLDLLFQAGNGPLSKIDGLTNEILIAVLIDRLTILNNRVSCPQNIRAISHLEDALANLKSRSLHREVINITSIVE